MSRLRKIVVASQYYLPDRSTTSVIMAAIAGHLATEAPVLVLSGMSGFAPQSPDPNQPTVIEIKSWRPAKGALVKRAAAEIAFSLRTFLALLVKLRRGDVLITVTAPFMAPYAAVAAARLRGARSVLILHDLYPDVLVMAGLLKPGSLVTKVIHGANALMYRALNAVVIIGRDAGPLLLRYKAMRRDRIRFIPNWATFAPGVRPISPENPYRRPHAARFVVGLSGNLAFTHDPVIVFEAARRLRDVPDIHFLLSGWGIGFERLKQMQAEARLENVTLVERVSEQDLEAFLCAANVWLIPYRKGVAGVSVPSRFYNLLAIGRPVILVSEPGAEAALTVIEHRLGWVVTPNDADELARTIRAASLSEDPEMAERAATIARRFGFAEAMASYSGLVQELLRSTP